MFRKRARDHVVINTESFGEYLQRRETIKSEMRAKQELRKAKNDLAGLHDELAEVKNLLKEILKERK